MLTDKLPGSPPSVRAADDTRAETPIHILWPDGPDPFATDERAPTMHHPRRPLCSLTRLRPVRNAALVAVVLVAGILGGCAATPVPANEPYLKAYTEAKYPAALRLADAKAAAASGSAKDMPQLIAGMSAYALGRHDEAVQRLRPLTSSSNREIAGKANTTLGQIALERGQHADAARQLLLAADQLSGDDSARARMLAGDAYARLRMTAAARDQWKAAEPRATDPRLRQAITDRLAGRTTDAPPQGERTAANPGPFTVQLGAFANRQAADTLISRASTQARQRGQPLPTMVMINEAGTNRQLFAVRVGEYPTREQAQTVLTRLGMGGQVVSLRR